MTLIEYLTSEVQLSQGTLQAFDSLWKSEEFPKGYQLLNEGSLSKKVYFVEKGLLRLYYIKDGKDITHHFFAEKNIYVPIENVFLNEPYPYNLELLENSTIRTVNFSTIEKYLDEDVKLQRLVRHIAISVIKQLADHLHSLQFQSAQERYSILLKKHPKILLRSPLGHIASYLGITQQTLSVIRAERSK
jgi:CRP-like cAMP-binding protein